jgi:hypothetical protein
MMIETKILENVFLEFCEYVYQDKYDNKLKIKQLTLHLMLFLLWRRRNTKQKQHKCISVMCY